MAKFGNLCHHYTGYFRLHLLEPPSLVNLSLHCSIMKFDIEDLVLLQNLFSRIGPFGSDKEKEWRIVCEYVGSFL